MKSRMRILFAAFLVVSVFILTACNGSVNGASDDLVEEEIESTQESTEGEDWSEEEVDEIVAEEDEPTEEVIEEVAEEETVDELEALRVNDGRTGTGFYLIRKDKVYTLNSLLGEGEYRPEFDYSSLGVKGNYSGVSGRALYWRNYDLVGTYGDIPKVIISRGEDKIISISASGEVSQLILFPVLDWKYTIGLFGGGHSDNFIDTRTGTNISIQKMNELEVLDANGNSIPVREKVTDKSSYVYCQDLVRNEEYTVSWYEGTQYNEYKTIADCRYYVFDENNYYTVDGELTKNGYAEYDISDLPAGAYVVYDQSSPYSAIEIG